MRVPRPARDEPAIAGRTGRRAPLAKADDWGCLGTFVVPRGELDLASARVLDAVLAVQAGPVVLDLRELTFVDGTGLSLLIDAQTRSSMDGRRLSFIAGPAVAHLLALLDLADPLTYA